MKRNLNINKKNNKTVFALCFNIMTLVLETLAVIFLFTIAIPRQPGQAWSKATWTTFKFFTTDSNILLLIASLISIIFLSLQINGKIKKICEFEYIFKLISVVSTSLTMFITLFILLPGAIATKSFVPAGLYMGSNLFMHLICPLVGVVSFLLFENRKDINLKKTLYSLILIVIYCIFYLSMAYTHLGSDGKPIYPQYDWYKFCHYGVGATIGFVIGISGVYFLFTWLLWLGNKKICLKEFK